MQLETLKKTNTDFFNEVKEYKTLKQELNELGGLDAIREKIKESSQEVQITKKQENELSFYKEQLEKQQSELDRFKSEVRNEKLENILRGACDKAKAKYELLKHVLKERISVDDKLSIEVKDANFDPLLVEGRVGTLDDLIESFREDSTFGVAFEKPVTTGSGARNSKTGGLSKSWDEMSLEERMQKAISDPSYVKRKLRA